MKNIFWALLCGTVILVAACSKEKTENAPTPKPSVNPEGAWKGKIIQGSLIHECSFVLSGKTFEFRDFTDTNVWYKGSYSLRDTDPRQLLGTIEQCAFPQYVGKVTMAIYRMEGDTLTISGNEPGKSAAPVTFDAPDAVRMELKRK